MKKNSLKKMKISPELVSLVREVNKLKEKGRKLGMFMEDRELLSCKKCGLMEDVAFNGLLMVYKVNTPIIDTGLRFEEIKGRAELFVCPGCRAKVKTKLW